jgi:hypothetical protein
MGVLTSAKSASSPAGTKGAAEGFREDILELLERLAWIRVVK